MTSSIKMTDLGTTVFIQHPDLCIVPAISLLALSMTSTPSFTPLVVLLAALRLYIRILIPRPRAFIRGLLLWISLVFSISLAHLLPSLHALSTPGISLISLLFISAISSTIALSLVVLDAHVCARTNNQWKQLILFPLIWATGWCAVAHASVNPFGRLVAWSPVLGCDWYTWVSPIVGPVGMDWTVGAWAAVSSQIVGDWFLGSESSEPLIPHESPSDPPQQSKQSWVLGIILVVLAVPSFVMTDLPSPPFSGETTPVTVGCVLPRTRSENFSPTLDDFVSESKKLTDAKILLWPEGAVRFDNAAEKQNALDRVRREVRGPYVGVAFEDFEPHGSAGQRGMRRTGLAIVSNDSEKVHLSYYKRHLVPIAESFSLTPSPDPPSIFTLNLHPPSGTAKTDWAPGPNHTRPIPLTASICLDFAQPAPFSELSTRPSLILAPARTWHTSVGAAMWEQAKGRAVEIGSMVLWCDGGEGGLSGIVGDGSRGVAQLGAGSWTRTIGIQWPFLDTQRKVYARIGDLSVLVFLWGVLGIGWFSGTVYVHAIGCIVHAVEWITEKAQRWRRRRSTQGESQPLL